MHQQLRGVTRMFQVFVLLLAALLALANAMPEEASIAATLREVTELLQVGQPPMDLHQSLQDLSTKLKQLESLQERVAQKESSLQSILRQANAQQFKDLEERLHRTLQKELELREKEGLERQKLQNLLEEQQSKKNAASNNDDDNLVVEVTAADLAQRLDTNAILGESEEEMKRWILSIVENEVDLYKQGILDKAPKDAGTSSDVDNANCPSLSKIVQTVQQALADDSEDDHAQGASVVHWLTSKTYAPPSANLGSVWWNKFIPQDWERLLPAGWETWEVGVPSYLYHSLGFMSGSVAPAEAVLQTNTLPGSCWPMEGSSGQIVLKLAYPVVVEAISVDHVSSKILPEGKHTSAPKKLKVIGYPSCREGHTDCEAVGFDLSAPVAIADMEYDVEGNSVQTFESHYAKAMASLPPEPEEASFGGESDGSCSVQSSCSKPPKTSVAAVEVRVLENWGNFDYTCLYRLRVHGEPA